MQFDAKAMQDAWTRFSFGTKRRMDFYKDMANADAAGIPPIQALTRMREVSAPRRSLRWLVNILDPVLKNAANGASFAVSMRPWVPPEDAALLSAGEEVGDLGSALRELVSLLESKLKVTGALKKNLIPSGVMLIAIIVLLIIIMNTIGPQAKEMVPAEIMSGLDILPHYIGFGEFIIRWGWLVALLVMGVGIVVWLSLSRWRPNPFREALDARVPPWSLTARVQTVFFLISASSMMRSGRTFKAAVEQIQRFSTPWSRDYLRQMLGRLRAGSSEIRAMQVGMLPWDVSDRLNFYAQLPDFAQVMQETARDSMEKLLRKVDFIGAMIRLVMMVLLAAFIIFTLMSVYDMSDGIERAAKNLQST